MSLSILESEIYRFLASPSPAVLCIRGAWGTGKTYAWNRCLKAAIENNRISHKRYSYVSLFGVNSLSSFKTEIIENTVQGRFLGSSPSFESFADVYASAEHITRKYSKILSGLPLLKNLAAAAEPAVFLAVRNQIICVDDLERKGTGLSSGDVLGLLSYLKEERGCKSVIILNKDELSDQNLFTKHLEKVADVSILFSPTSQECVNIALSDNSEESKIICEYCIALNIQNVRTIKKIVRLVDQSKESYLDRDPRLFREAIKTLVVLSWVEFSSGDVPDISFLQNRGRFLGLTRDMNYSESEEKWRNLLKEIDFNGMDDVDKILSQGVREGYFDRDRIAALLKVAEQSLRDTDLTRQFHEAWELYYSTLEHNESELSDSIYTSFKAAAQLISLNNLDSTVRLLKEIGYEEKALELISHYFDNGFVRKDDLALPPGHPLRDIKDVDVVKAFNKHASSIIDSRPIDDIIKEISEDQCTRMSVQALSLFSVDEIKGAIRRLRGPRIKSAIENCFAYSNQFDFGITLREKMRDVIKSFASESKLNALRMKTYHQYIEPER